MQVRNRKKRILVAPLNWGLGHATRCIPIIKALIEQGFEPVLASDGIALNLLQKEFPQLESTELPSYQISYSKKRYFFKLKLIQNTPKIVKAIKAEKKLIADIIEALHIDGIISDNRLGAHNKKLPCVFITHQLQVLSGNTTWLSTKLHQKIFRRFDECWVPDNIGDMNLSGKLGHDQINELPIKYIGPLSRFEKKDTEPIYDIMVLLSGPEPQRTFLETKLLKKLCQFEGNVLFVKGQIENEQQISEQKHITNYNFMMSGELGDAINKSKLVISRSGYTTVMDLAKLSKKAFFIPTPGQFEQEYLAKRLDEQGFVPSCSQNEFNLDQLERLKDYTGLKSMDYELNYRRLFGLFEGK